MPLATDSKTRQLLRGFAQRRRRMLLLRGAAAGLVTLLVGMGLVSLIDRLVVMDMPLRLALSLLAYAAAVGVTWTVAGRHLVRRDSPAALAQMLEAADPRLQDRLVAAVELSQQSSHPQAGSASFRQALQQEAAALAAQVDLDRTLPWRLVGWWLGTALGAALLCVMLLAVPRLQFGRMLSRALLPTAEIPRASRYTVEFIGLPSQALFAAGEPTPVQVRVTGGAPQRVWLEVESAQGQTQVVPMQPADAGVYHIDLSLQVPSRLTAWADDAQSRSLQVEVRQRPSVLAFTRRYRPPAYLVNHVQTSEPVTSAEGDLAALSGSMALLEITADQAVRGGQIELLGKQGEPIAGVAPIALVRGEEDSGQRVLRAQVPMEFDGSYCVVLESAETGFETRDPPAWPLRIWPDVAPTIATTGAAEPRPAPADALVALEAQVSDDVGLAWIRRDFRINGGEWTTEPVPLTHASIPATLPTTTPTTLAAAPIREQAVRLPLDLMPLGLLPGDRAEARLVVTDLKGSEAVASLGEWNIASEGLDEQRMAVLDQKHRLLTAAEQLTAATRALHDEAQQARSQLEELQQEAADDSIQVDQLWLSLVGRVRSIEAGADAVIEAARTATAGAVTSVDAAAFEAVGESASHLRHERSGQLLTVLQSERDAASRIAAVEATASEADSLARQMRRLADALLRTEQTAAVAAEAKALEREAASAEEQLLRLLDDGRATFAWQQYSRRQGAIGWRLLAMIDRLASARTDLSLRDPAVARLADTQITLGRALERLQRALRGAPGERLREPAREMQQALTAAGPELAEAVLALERWTREEQTTLRDDLGLLSTSDALQQLAAALQQESPAPETVWQSVRRRLADRIALHERRPQLDRAFLGDLGLARQAVTAMEAAAQRLADPAPLADRAAEVAAAVAVLESGHEVVALHEQLSGLSQALQVTVDPNPLLHARQLTAIAGTTPSVAAALAEGEHDAAAISQLERLLARGPLQPLVRSFERQIRSGGGIDQANRVAERLAELARGVEEVLTLIQPRMEAARATLSAEAITLAGWMRQLAQEAQVLAQQTPTTEDPADAARAQRAMSERLRELERAIRRDAAQQDLMTNTGRVRARDADDAVAMLQRDPIEAADQLRRAVEAPEAHPEALARAAEAQERLAQTLRELADHWENLEAGDPAASRQALREREAELGLKERLDDEYQRLARLAELQELDDRELLEALQEELQNDPAMQRELSKLATEAARTGSAALQQAAASEREAEAAIEQAAEQAARSDETVAEELPNIARDAQRLAEEQLPPLEQAIAQAEDDPEDTAAEALAAARQRLEEAARSGAQNDLAATEAQLAEARERLREADQARRQAAAETDQAQQQARRQAEAARAAGQDDSAAEAQLQAAAEASEKARQQAVAMRRVRREVGALQDRLNQTRQRADAVRREADRATESAQASQDSAQQQSSAAAGALERASRHEQRLGNSTRAGAINQAAESAQQAAQQAVPAASEALSQAKESGKPGEARGAVSAARQALEQSAQAAAEAQATAPDTPTPAASDRVGSMMAQALDRLDRAMNPAPGTPPADRAGPQGQPADQASPEGENASSQVARAMAQQAAEAQARAFRTQRLPSAAPGSPTGASAGADLSRLSENGDLGQRPEAGGDWGHLPPDVVRDLLQGRRDVAPAEFRDLVDAYYRAIAERARRGE